MDRIFFEIEPMQQNDETVYVAKVQVSDLLKGAQFNIDLAEKIEYLEKLYKNTIIYCKQQRADIKKIEDKKRILTYWNIADRIWRYLGTSERKGFFLNNYHKHFIRDLNTSRTTFERLIRLRRAVRKKSGLDSTKPWTYYTR